MKRKLKFIVRRLGGAENLIAGLKTMAGALREGLAGSLGLVLAPGEPMPDVELLLTLLQRRVAALGRRVAFRQEILEERQECERFSARSATRPPPGSASG